MKYDATRVPGYNGHCKTYSTRDYASFAESACKRDGYRFIGLSSPWQGTNKTKVIFICPKHGENSTTNVNRFLNQGARCVKCRYETLAESRSANAEHWKNLLIERCGYKNDINVEMKDGEPWVWCPVCADDEFSLNGISGAWFRTPTATIHYGGKSCRCSGKLRRTPEERLYLVSKRCGLLGYDFCVEDHVNLGCKDKVSIACPQHGLFRSLVGNFLGLDTICPQCAEYGYQKALPGTVYLLYSECGQYMKIGITNKMKSRLKGLRTTTPFKFKVAATKSFDDGSEAREYELRLHSMYTPANLAGFSGCTEWFRLDGSALLYF